MRYSRADKTSNAFRPDGLFSVIHERLAPVSCTICEVLTASEVFGIYDATKGNVLERINGIMAARGLRVI